MPTTARGIVKELLGHPANRGRRVRALAAMAKWQVRKRLVKQPGELQVYAGMRFQAYPDSTQVGRFVYFGGLPDYEEMMFMRRYLRPGDGFIDGGANEGMFTLLAAQLVGGAGEVHAFEAIPTYVSRLNENVTLNALSQVTVHEAAIGDRAGEVVFALRGTGSRIHTVEDDAHTVTVRMVRLDDELPAHAWAMGKLDLEGAEPLALAGAELLTEAAQPAVWMLELVDHMLDRFGSSVSDVRMWLTEHGYDTVLYEPITNRLVPAPDPLWPLADLLAVHRDRRSEVEERLHAHGTSNTRGW